MHNVMSHIVLLITFTGRKSGKTYTIPVENLHHDMSPQQMVAQFFKLAP